MRARVWIQPAPRSRQNHLIGGQRNEERERHDPRHDEEESEDPLHAHTDGEIEEAEPRDVVSH